MNAHGSDKAMVGRLRDIGTELLFLPCLLVMLIYWGIGSLFHRDDDNDWADLAN